MPVSFASPLSNSSETPPATSGGDGLARFFADLPLQTDFRAITGSDGFAAVPPEWWVALADVANSTDAIARGRYKDVNTVGAMAIVGLLNAAPLGVELPFVFGGDGATVLVPPTLLPDARAVLEDMRAFARLEFGLVVRIGVYSVAQLYAAGAKLRVAKWSVSPLYTQALFTGGGLTLAESWVKHPETGPPASPLPFVKDEDDENEAYTPDYRGFHCRWATIPSPREENISLLVESIDSEESAQRETYRSVLDEIERIYGSADERHPIAPHKMRLTFEESDLMNEVRVHHPQSSDGEADNGESDGYRRAACLRGLQYENAATNLFMWLKMRSPAKQLRRWFHGVADDAPPMEWGKHKAFIRETSDCQKVDGTLRLIIAGYPAQRTDLTAFLEQGVKEKKLVYGLHVAGGALMTCLVFQPNGRQVHFVDGANGGYALAARALKARKGEGAASNKKHRGA